MKVCKCCILLVCGLLLQTGCIGVSVVAGTKQVEVSKTIGDHVGDADYIAGAVTDSTVCLLWGKPKHKTQRGDSEVWIYKSDELSWRGFQVWTIIPIPLLLPVGYKKVTLGFNQGLLTKYTIDNGRERFFGYFMMNGLKKVWQFNQEEVTGGCHGYYGCY